MGFFESLAELFMPLVELLARTGRIGGIIAVMLGLALIAAGLYLTFGLIEDGIWPIMLSVSVLGLVFALLGVGVLFGSQARFAAALRSVSDVDRSPQGRDVEAARTLDPPFWVCSDCRVVELGTSCTARCTRCGHVTSFVQVTNENERRTALACLS